MKVLFVRNLVIIVIEEILEKLFFEFGKFERVKKLKDYVFVYFEDRGVVVKVEVLKFWFLVFEFYC